MPDHIDSPDCWCKPYVYFKADNGNKVWVHRGMLPPPPVLASAIASAITDDEKDHLFDEDGNEIEEK